METAGNYNVDDRDVALANIQDKIDFEVQLRKFINEASLVADGDTLVALSQALVHTQKNIYCLISQYKYLDSIS